MKKYISIIIITLLTISITACGNKQNSQTTDTTGTTIEATDVVTDEDATEVTTGETTDVTTEDTSSESSERLDFSTTDINGVPIKLDDIKGSTLIMVNFWEPWCGPCVGEMPGLEKLYQNYKDKGLTVLGVFYSIDSMDDAKAVISDNNITYPVVVGNDDFINFTTEYVPTTVFVDSEGKLLSGEPLIGSRSYEEWEQEVLKYLNE